jgi:hypothetical protein
MIAVATSMPWSAMSASGFRSWAGASVTAVRAAAGGQPSPALRWRAVRAPGCEPGSQQSRGQGGQQDHRPLHGLLVRKRRRGGNTDSPDGTGQSADDSGATLGGGGRAGTTAGAGPGR